MSPFTVSVNGLLWTHLPDGSERAFQRADAHDLWRDAFIKHAMIRFRKCSPAEAVARLNVAFRNAHGGLDGLPARPRSVG